MESNTKIEVRCINCDAIFLTESLPENLECMCHSDKFEVVAK